MNAQHKTCIVCGGEYSRQKNTSLQRWLLRKYCSNTCSRQHIADKQRIAERLERKGNEPLAPKVVEVKIDTGDPLFRFLSGKHRQEVGY